MRVQCRLAWTLDTRNKCIKVHMECARLDMDIIYKHTNQTQQKAIRNSCTPWFHSRISIQLAFALEVIQFEELICILSSKTNTIEVLNFECVNRHDQD